ncbi:Molecular chaperone DnaJ [Apiospora marii]|uniref:Molecular chaperone DnaJ n=1 Tax=Apiospora marii TaxID=335849 RepID=UPI00312D69F5
MFSLPDDPYARLGVSQDAQIPEIRQAHRKLVLKCHPDKVSDPEQKAIKQEEFQKVQRAYEMLSDSKERQKYDDMVRANEMEKTNVRIRTEQAAYSSRTPPRRESNTETHHYNVRMAEPRGFERTTSSYGATSKSNPAYASGRTPPRSYEENVYSSSYDDTREHRSSRKAGGGASSYEREVPSSRRAEESDKRSRKEADRAWDRQREKAEKDASRRKAEEKERDRREKEKDKDRRKKKEEAQQKERKREGEEKRTRHRSPYREEPEPLSPIILEARHKEEKPKSKANTRAKVVDPPAPVREAITEDRHRVKQDANLEFAAKYLQSSRSKVMPGPVRSKTYHPSLDTHYAPPVPTPPPAASAMAPPPPPMPDNDEPVKRSSARRSSETPRSKLSSSHRKSSRVVEEEPRAIPGFKKYSSMPTQRHSPPEVPESPPRMHRSQTDSYSRPMPGPHPGLARAQTWYPAPAAEDDYRDSGRSKHHTRYHSDEDYDEYSEDERYNSRRPTRHHSPEAPKTKFRYTVEGNKTVPVRPRAESPRRGYKAAPYYSHEASSGRPMASYDTYEQPAAYFSKVKYAPKYDVDDVAYSTTSEAGYRMTEPPQVYGY